MVSRFELVCEGGNDSTCNERGMNVCIRVVYKMVGTCYIKFIFLYII